MKKLLKNRKLIAVVALVLVVLLGPYLWSRFVSSSVQVQTFTANGTQPEPAKGTIRVACYNIAHGRGLAESNWDGGDAATRLARLDDIAELLREINADVVVLNEVDFDTSWSNNINQAAVLAEKAGYPFRVEERNLDFRVLHRTWRFGNAILSKYPISDAAAVDLPSFAGWETMLAGKKRAVRCDVTAGQKKFRIFGLHLSHRSEEVRERSAAKVVQLVRESPHPCVVMGDLNSTPPGFPKSSETPDGKNAITTIDTSADLHRQFVDILAYGPQHALPFNEKNLTFRADDPQIIIDWIYLSQSMEFEQYRTVNSLLSDHRPVVADFSFE